mmetsp:Transcript_3880/g.7249  ORF Transcript_3880/g.7249 Transcript_3880/m.7249 type:complete len:233 (+) Transcript_3880:893-1591(+)
MSTNSSIFDSTCSPCFTYTYCWLPSSITTESAAMSMGGTAIRFFTSWRSTSLSFSLIPYLVTNCVSCASRLSPSLIVRLTGPFGPPMSTGTVAISLGASKIFRLSARSFSRSTASSASRTILWALSCNNSTWYVWFGMASSHSSISTSECSNSTFSRSRRRIADLVMGRRVVNVSSDSSSSIDVGYQDRSDSTLSRKAVITARSLSMLIGREALKPPSSDGIECLIPMMSMS